MTKFEPGEVWGNHNGLKFDLWVNIQGNKKLVWFFEIECGWVELMKLI